MENHNLYVLSPENYTAIGILEQIGLKAPTQEQINFVEAVILITLKQNLPFLYSYK